MAFCPKIKSGARPKMQITAATWIKSVMLYAAAGFFVLTSSAIADDSVAADEFLKSKPDLEQEAKSKEIEEIVTPMFDFKLMARLSLGREQWAKLSEENRGRFTDLFISNLRGSYLNRIKAYTDEKVIYDPPVKVDEKTHIPTYLISKGKKIEMRYKFYQSNGQWKIYDLEIQGVSIIRSYLAQFKEILQNGTFDDLLLKMEKPTND
jgi:phospholipid transport system substrate-binding protein